MSLKCLYCFVLRPALFVLCVTNVSLNLTRFDAKHNNHILSVITAVEMASALWGPLLTMAVHTFPLRFGLDWRSFLQNPSSGCHWKELRSRSFFLWEIIKVSALSDLGLTVDSADSLDVQTLCAPAWPKTRFYIATSTKRTDGQQRQPWAKNY